MPLRADSTTAKWLTAFILADFLLASAIYRAIWWLVALNVVFAVMSGWNLWRLAHTDDHRKEKLQRN